MVKSYTREEGGFVVNADERESLGVLKADTKHLKDSSLRIEGKVDALATQFDAFMDAHQIHEVALAERIATLEVRVLTQGKVIWGVIGGVGSIVTAALIGLIFPEILTTGG